MDKYKKLLKSVDYKKHRIKAVILSRKTYSDRNSTLYSHPNLVIMWPLISIHDQSHAISKYHRWQPNGICRIRGRATSRSP